MVLLLLCVHVLLAQAQKRVKPGVVGVNPAAVYLGHPVGDAPGERPVVRDEHQRAYRPDEVLLQPEDCVNVQMIGWLVQEQQI